LTDHQLHNHHQRQERAGHSNRSTCCPVASHSHTPGSHRAGLCSLGFCFSRMSCKETKLDSNLLNLASWTWSNSIRSSFLFDCRIPLCKRIIICLSNAYKLKDSNLLFVLVFFF
jgi:hypothetical protein